MNHVQRRLPLRRTALLAASLAAAMVAAMSLPGCVAIEPAAQTRDDAVPAEVGGPPPAKGCLAGGLPANGTCWFALQSTLLLGDSGVRLAPGQCVHLSVPAGQTLHDASREVPMPQGDAGSSFTRMFNFLKRDTARPWFALMAQLGPDERNAVAVNEHPDLCAPAAGASAALGFWVNDWRHAYGNNHGRVWVKVSAASGAVAGR